MVSCRRFGALLLVGALAACEERPDPLSPTSPPSGVSPEADSTALPDLIPQSSNAGGQAQMASLMSGPTINLLLEEPAGFVIELLDRECASPSNTVSLTSPLQATLTTTMCQEPIGTTWPVSTIYPDSTTITIDFFSGFINQPGNLRLRSGAFPEWTIEAEDGNPTTGDWNDFVLSCRALLDCQLFEQGAPTVLLDDIFVKDALRQLGEMTGFSDPVNDRRERRMYIYEKDQQVNVMQVELLPPISSCMAREVPGQLQSLKDDPEIIVRAVVHSHIASDGVPMNTPPECWMVTPSGELYLEDAGVPGFNDVGPSVPDWQGWHNTPDEAAYEGWMLNPDKLWRWWQTGGPSSYTIGGFSDHELNLGANACIQ